MYHDFGLAIIKKATPRRPPPNTDRFQAQWLISSTTFVREKEANYPKSWAGVVAGPPNGSVPKKLASDGAVPAFAASVASVAVPRSQSKSSPIPVPQVSVPACVSPVTIPTDLSSIMAAAIEAALQPMKERLEATIVPMQRTLETLQTEFVALRTQEKIEPMTSGAATDAKRLRLGSDV